MKAARYHGPRDIRVEVVDDPPPPASHEVTLDVLWGGICGTDLHEYVSGPMTINKPEKPHGITGDHLPVSFGHEFCGRVSALPDGYNGPLKMGTPIMVDPRIICRECPACTSGLDNICPNWGYIGLNGGGGGGGGLYVDLNSVVLCQPLTVGRHALGTSGLTNFQGVNVLVLGGGPVGLAVVLNLRAKGCGVGGSGRVFISEPTTKRRQMIKDLELSRDVLNPVEVNVAEVCREATGGVGVDVVFDSAGAESAMLAGMESLKLRGTYVNIAGWREPFKIPMQFAMFREINIKFSLGNNDEDYRDVVQDFVAGKFAGAHKLITRRLPVADLAEHGLEELVRNKDDHVKIVATWKDDLLSASRL
ncbi:putative diacetyl [(R)-acetoin forming] 2 [Cyphellophora attinorum]|uniref:Putative diacetyl [(R)-acetoin forming] 2 n=1 Tax=Cyphellophora attinorum TaxID=1664694 RepID=A0A0N1HH27_9EURO|nr:putative diacetyl [(R)-acetoin forming] 2 [Phialophora attinorum]KPI45166.1 putative diacetyl [(R)-acetoin forming] 2 [Phialophora attinorum]